MNHIEVMKLALEALEINLPIAYAKNGRGERFPCFSDDPLREIKTREAITALRQALERPQFFYGQDPNVLPASDKGESRE